MLPHPVALYVRISHDPIGARAGVERQLADCTAIANLKGWGANLQRYEDNDRSAYSGRRPEFERLLADLPRLSGVIAWDMDRLVRQPSDLERFLNACAAAKLTRVVTAQGDIDLTTHDGQLHARILAAVSKKESDDKSRRVSRAALDRAERGLWNGGPVPYGYRRSERPGVLEVDHAAATVVRDVAVAVVDGMSLAWVVEHYRDLPGAPRTRPGWRALLLSPTIRGMTSRAVAQWPAIIDSDLAANVKAVLTDPDRLSHHGTERARWLSGVLVCASCDGWMRWHGREGSRAPRYRCVGCRSVTVGAAAVEAFVKGAVLSAAPTVEQARDRAELDTGGSTAAEVEARWAQVNEDYASGYLSRSDWMQMRAILEAMKPAKPITPITPSETITAQGWEQWSATERYRAVCWLLERIMVWSSVDRGRALEDRIEFVWRR